MYLKACIHKDYSNFILIATSTSFSLVHFKTGGGGGGGGGVTSYTCMFFCGQDCVRFLTFP